MAFTYRDLEAWQLSMTLVERTYQITSMFPPSERFGAASQLRRAAISIPSNLAEGHCRRTTNAYLNHVSIALGSHGELCTLLEISQRVGLMTTEPTAQLTPLTAAVGRLLYGLHNALKARARG